MGCVWSVHGKLHNGKGMAMKKTRALLLVGVAMLILGYATVALAADAPAAAPAKEAAKPAAAPAAAKPAAPPATTVKGEVTGKVEPKMHTDKKTGKETKGCVVAVSEAKGAGGKALDALKGKQLRVTGPKAADVEKLEGKVVTIAGTIINNKKIEAESVKEAAAPAAPAAPAKK